MNETQYEASLRLAILKRSEAVEQRAQLAVLLAATGRRAEAIAILREGVVYAMGREDRLEQLGEALLAVDALPEALEVLQAASRLCHDDTRLRARIKDLSAQLKEGPTATRQLFNQYATKFEEELASLHYTVPGQIAHLLAPYEDRFRHGRIIDLGCGTGLMGNYLKQFAFALVGIDLSPAMLEQASAKHIYDELIEGDIVAQCLILQPKSALITAADVLVYIGDLRPLFAAVASILVSKGLFAFTVERAASGSFEINETKRFTHSETYIRNAASGAGFTIIYCEQITPRYDRGRPVDGLMVLLELL